MSDYDPGATGADQPWGSPQPPPQPTGGWGAPPGGGPPPAPPYGGPLPYGSPAPDGGQQLPPYAQFGSPQQSNWGAPPAALGQLATWVPRAGAIFIDWLIIFIPSLVLGILQATTHSVVFQVLDYVWEFGMWSWFSVQVGMTGSSPGMRVVGLRCVRSSTGQLIGGGLGFLRGLLNLILFILCVVPGVVSFLWPLWDSQRQTLPDKIVGTLVYRVQPEGFSLFPKRTAA